METHAVVTLHPNPAMDGKMFFSALVPDILLENLFLILSLALITAFAILAFALSARAGASFASRGAFGPGASQQ